ncbi:MAG: hypothetical protein DME63_09695 [Verrucomicrobia bacterium]|nr:MAG: hypothetical protein DME63_09695 [Verrucomicrobiota bacterium]
MPKNLRFWTNVTLIALAHVVLIVGLIRLSRENKSAGAQSVVWLDGGAGDGMVTQKKNLAAPVKSPLPRKESKTDELRERDPDEDRPYLASAPSDIQLPTPKPTQSATPARSSKPSPTAKAKTTPKPAAKPTPKPTPTASPARTPLPKKIVVARSKKSPATQTGTGTGTAPGSGAGRAGGTGSESQFGWYGSMLHDHFYSEWVQPTTIATVGAKNSVLAKLRIEKDGRVSSFEVVRPSGNNELDESVKALANRVSRVEPLPDGLGKGDHYDVKINFELNSE